MSPNEIEKTMCEKIWESPGCVSPNHYAGWAFGKTPENTRKGWYKLYNGVYFCKAEIVRMRNGRANRTGKR